MTTLARVARPVWTGVRMLAVLTVILGLAYPLFVTGVGQLFFPGQANGSVVYNGAGVPVGSALIGQPFTDAAGNPLRQYFQPRPSVAGDGYDPRSSSGSNLGPENAELIAEIEARRAAVAYFNGVAESEVPPDAVTASGSGLDPQISPEYAAIQVARVAAARGLAVDEVRALVARYTVPPALGYIGAPGVNVLELNLALDEL